MSAFPVSSPSHPPHGHPDNTPDPSTQASDKPSTSSHPPSTKPDPTTVPQNAQGRLSAAHPTSASKLPSLQMMLKKSLRQYPDFPSPGILFEDITPIFTDPTTHDALITALELHILSSFSESDKPDIIVGLEARGFLFGPTLALRLGAGFVPIRKKGKLPGHVETASYKKEYGEDFFQIQSDSIKPGQRVFVVDDVLATGALLSLVTLVKPVLIHLGGTAAAAGALIRRVNGNLLGYAFLMELDFLKGRKNLDAPVYTLLTGQEK